MVLTETWLSLRVPSNIQIVDFDANIVEMLGIDIFYFLICWPPQSSTENFLNTLDSTVCSLAPLYENVLVLEDLNMIFCLTILSVIVLTHTVLRNFRGRNAYHKISLSLFDAIFANKLGLCNSFGTYNIDHSFTKWAITPLVGTGGLHWGSEESIGWCSDLGSADMIWRKEGHAKIVQYIL